MTHPKQSWKLAFIYWLPLAAAIVIVSGLVYVAVQQNYRLSANDPQIQLAEDYARGLAQGQGAPDNIAPANPTMGMADSLYPFIIIYSATGTPIVGSVQLDGKMPVPPSGVLDYAKQHGQDRFTWQPKSDVRVAAVVTYSGGSRPAYVLVGRLLREVEIREAQLLKLSAAATIVALLVAYLLVLWIVVKFHHPHAEHAEREEAMHRHHEV